MVTFNKWNGLVIDFPNNADVDILEAAQIPSPVVSVIVPTHNRPSMLKDTIQSILDQTFQDFEIIVINDAGQDVSSVVQSFGSPKIVYLSHETNKGLAAARNSGIRAAKGKYIAYLDDDDVFYPDHLEMLATFLQKTGEKVAYTDAFRAHQRLEDGHYVTYKKDTPYSYDFDYDRILYENFIPVLCFMHEKECFNVCGMFDENFCCLEDWELWLRMSRSFTMHHIKILTCEYRYRLDGSNMLSGSLGKFLYMTEQLYKKHPVVIRPDIRDIRSDLIQQMLKANITEDAFATVQFFFDNGSGFSEDNSVINKISIKSEAEKISFDVSNISNLTSIRIDPHCDSVVLKLESIIIESDNSETDLVTTGNIISNAIRVEGDIYYFESEDPQLIFSDIEDNILTNVRRIVFKAKFISLGKDALHTCIKQIIQKPADKKVQVQMFYDDGTGMCEAHSVSKSLYCNGEIQKICFKISSIKNLRNIRIDPHSDSVVLALESINIESEFQEFDLLATGRMLSNATIVEGNVYYFETDDPQFFFSSIDEYILAGAQKVVFKAKYISLGKDALQTTVMSRNI